MLIFIHSIHYVRVGENFDFSLVNQFIDKYSKNFSLSGLERLQANRRSSVFCANVNLTEMVMCLEDLINYFAQPEEEMGKHFYMKSFLIRKLFFSNFLNFSPFSPTFHPLENSFFASIGFPLK